MKRIFYQDLFMVLFLTIISLICLLIPALNLYPLNIPIHYVAYILLLLFLPGYSLLAAHNPLYGQSSIIKRVICSIVVSISISILLALLLTYTPLKIFNTLMIYSLIAFTILLTLIAILKRRRYHYVHFIEEGEAPQTNGLKPIEPEDLSKDIISPEDLKTVNSDESNIEEIVIKPFKTNQSQPDGKKTSRFAYTDLILVLLLTILSLLTVIWPLLNVGVLDPLFNNYIFHTLINLLLMLFLPGYALTAVLYPRRTGLDGVRRLVLSFAISYFLTTLIGLVLNYMSPGMMNLQLYILSGLSLFFIIAAFLVRWSVPAESRYYVNFSRLFRKSETSPKSGTSPGSGSRTRNILVVIMVIIAVLLIATPAYNMMKPAEAKYTEFYILGPDGNNFTEYPANLTQGEGGNVTLVLVNHENTNTTYRIVFTSNQTVLGEMNVTLKADEKKLIPYNFTAGDPGTFKYEFLLYKLPDLKDIYLTGNFWVNILEIIPETEYNETSEETSSEESEEESEY